MTKVEILDALLERFSEGDKRVTVGLVTVNSFRRMTSVSFLKSREDWSQQGVSVALLDAQATLLHAICEYHSAQALCDYLVLWDFVKRERAGMGKWGKNGDLLSESCKSESRVSRLQECSTDEAP